MTDVERTLLEMHVAAAVLPEGSLKTLIYQWSATLQEIEDQRQRLHTETHQLQSQLDTKKTKTEPSNW